MRLSNSLISTMGTDGTSTTSDEWQHAALKYALTNVGGGGVALGGDRRTGLITRRPVRWPRPPATV
jgi:hypothetical protein